MSIGIEWDPNDMPEDERKKKESYIQRGVFTLPPNNLQCEICKAISYLAVPPKVGNVYECANCKTVFIMNRIEDNGRYYSFRTLKFRSKYDYNEFRKVKTREEFKRLFQKNNLGIFQFRL